MRLWSVWHGILFKDSNSAGSRPSDGLCEQKEPLTPERKRGQKRGPTQLNKLHSHHGAHTVPGPPGICHRTGKFPGPRHLRPESPWSGPFARPFPLLLCLFHFTMYRIKVSRDNFKFFQISFTACLDHRVNQCKMSKFSSFYYSCEL